MGNWRKVVGGVSLFFLISGCEVSREFWFAGESYPLELTASSISHVTTARIAEDHGSLVLIGEVIFDRWADNWPATKVDQHIDFALMLPDGGAERQNDIELKFEPPLRTGDKNPHLKRRIYSFSSPIKNPPVKGSKLQISIHEGPHA